MKEIIQIKIHGDLRFWGQFVPGSRYRRTVYKTRYFVHILSQFITVEEILVRLTWNHFHQNHNTRTSHNGYRPRASNFSRSPIKPLRFKNEHCQYRILCVRGKISPTS